MESNVTIIVYAVLLALLGVVYWMINRKDVLGKRSQATPQSGFLTRFGRSPHSNPNPGPTPENRNDNWAEVASVLEDMYREFAYKIGELDARFDQLEKGIDEVIHRADALERRLEQHQGHRNALTHAPNVDTESPSEGHPDTQSHAVRGPFDARYLEVLDRLQSGQDPEGIATEMGVSMSEVQQVLAIMMISPNDM